ncbi:MAG: hypothetical protein KDA57_00020 [Planctomycetales bacterium]|nr:hypothetical protein [Planctomycetales bacterium]
MITKTEKPGLARELELFRSVPLAAIPFLASQDMRLYCCRESDSQPVLLCNMREAAGEATYADLEKRGFESLLVQKQDFPHVSQVLLESVDSLLADSSSPSETCFALLQIAYAREIERLFCKPRLEQYVALAQEIGRKISTLGQEREMSIAKLFKQVHHNSETYSHVTNVAAYAVTLAQALEMATPRELDEIAVGCMLHEVGRLWLPGGLMAQKGRLSARDTQEIERAPQLAYEALIDFKELSFGQLMMAYQQHERVDGTGYPVRTLQKDIHPWAKLLAVADVLDAVTSSRAYRSAHSLREALLHLTYVANKHLEPEMVLCLITNSQCQ